MMGANASTRITIRTTLSAFTKTVMIRPEIITEAIKSIQKCDRLLILLCFV